jgi:hypothetical protein
MLRQNERNKAKNKKGQGKQREKLNFEERAAADAAQAAFNADLNHPHVDKTSGHRDAILAVLAIVVYLTIGVLFYGGVFISDDTLEWTVGEVAYFAFATITTGTRQLSHLFTASSASRHDD